MVGRARTKSRTGCRECKHRHRKCDETRPSCVNCRTTNQRCSFLALAARTPGRPNGASPSSCMPTAQMSGALAAVSAGTASMHSETNPASQPSGPAFTMRHMELLYHFRTGVMEGLEINAWLDLTVRHAFQVPWLMDQILAVSAAHLSALEAGNRRSHQVAAAQLQAKALAQFTAGGLQTAADNYVATYLFSLLVAMQAMFETLSARAELPAFLDRLADWFHLSRGVVRVLNHSSDVNLCQSMDPRVFASGKYRPVPRSVEEQISCDRFDGLIMLIEQSNNLTESAITATKAAVEALYSLHFIQASPQISRTYQVQLPMKWPFLVSPEYVRLLDQRCPEALVVLGHYAILLHHARFYPPIGDSGRVLIESITHYLGPQWEEWVAWPNELMAKADSLVI